MFKSHTYTDSQRENGTGRLLIYHGHTLNEKKSNLPITFWCSEQESQVLTAQSRRRHYGVQGGLGEEQDPWLSKLVARPGNWKRQTCHSGGLPCSRGHALGLPRHRRQDTATCPWEPNFPGSSGERAQQTAARDLSMFTLINLISRNQFPEVGAVTGCQVSGSGY